ncbi:MAG: ATP-dependent helicase [Coleofasciculus chthonoplastes F3-SA18-01]|uniref:ATP-dependent helicase n=1 Tax=Coleofasciculus chthonoplastes TaxID=64178 RepID=UPI0032FAB609
MSIYLSEKQKQIVQHGDGALLVIASPGSGKTRVLTERIRRLLTESKGHFRILALTFTNKAANEMRERLAEFPDIHQRTFIGTLHSFCLEVLANRGKSVGIEGRPNLLESNQDRRQILLQAVMDDPKLKLELYATRDAKSQRKKLSEWFNTIERSKKDLYPPEAIGDYTDRMVYEAYNQALRSSNTVDFDDLLLLTYQLLTERPKIADFYRRQYRYICIDEAQDLNEAQYQVICALCGSEYRNVMMVGDPKQAIFGWNGADPKYLEGFERDFQAKRIEMIENFRSSEAVVRTAKKLDPNYRVEGSLPIQGDIDILVADDEKHEAILVVNYLQDIIKRGHPDIEGSLTLEHCTILGRTRYVLSEVEEELSQRQIPYYKQLSPQDESESDLIKDFQLCLRLLVNPRDRFHLSILLNRWQIDEKPSPLPDGYDGLKLITTLTKLTSNNPNPEIVLNAIQNLGYTEQGNCQFLTAMDSLDTFAQTLENEEERALIMEDIQLWRRHWNIFLRSQPGGKHSLTSFLSQVAMGTTQQPKQEGLALLTVHSSKGLEFDVVFLVGMTEGTFPDYRAKDEGLEEEKRNMFVATTRARRILVFSYPRTKKMPWGDIRKQEPSRYLKMFDLI